LYLKLAELQQQSADLELANRAVELAHGAEAEEGSCNGARQLEASPAVLPQQARQCG
jgi:hypothetical protein